MMGDIHDAFLKITDQLLTEESKIWLGSKFERFKALSCDKRGSNGERWLFQNLVNHPPFCRRLTYTDGDRSKPDLTIFNKIIEVKTASLDVNRKFQHEGLIRADFNILTLVDVAPNDLYVSVYIHDEIPWDQLHSREKAKTGRGYKFDLSQKKLEPISSEKEIYNLFEIALRKLGVKF